MKVLIASTILIAGGRSCRRHGSISIGGGGQSVEDIIRCPTNFRRPINARLGHRVVTWLERS